MTGTCISWAWVVALTAVVSCQGRTTIIFDYTLINQQQQGQKRISIGRAIFRVWNFDAYVMCLILYETEHVFFHYLSMTYGHKIK